MATVTPGKIFTANEIVTPTNLNALGVPTVSNIVNADISASAAIADTKLEQISTTNKVANSATTATNANTANAIVARDASGNFSAGTITASLSGNSSTATSWATSRNLSLTGDVTATLSNVNGSANVSANATIANLSITTAKIADANVTTAKIADSNVTTAKIADSNVTTAKIANGSVTAVKLGSDIFLVPPGAIMPFAMNYAPSGWLAADGAAVSRTTYATLFAAIGTYYGVGNGSTTFNLPDLRGYFVRGSGTNADGTASGAFGLKQADGFKSHTHTENSAGSHTHTGSTNTAGSHTHTISEGSKSSVAGGLLTSGDDYTTIAYTSQTTSAGGEHSHWLAIDSGGDHTHTINATGTTETRPANIALLYCIKF